jgi:hypothetical protein
MCGRRPVLAGRAKAPSAPIMARTPMLLLLTRQVFAAGAPAEPGFLSRGCASWVDALSSNHLARGHQPNGEAATTPNAAPCCSPTPADLSAPCPASRSTWPCPACLDQCTPGTDQREIFLLGKPETLEACKSLAASFSEAGGLRCVSVSWVDGKKDNEIWARNCWCGTSTVSWMPGPASQDGVDSAYCVEYHSAWGWMFLGVTIPGVALYVGIGVFLQSRAQGGRPRLGLHPHYSRWVEIRGLVLDGIKFSQQRMRGGGRATPAQTTTVTLLDERHDHASDAGSVRSGGSRSSKSSKSSGQSRKKKAAKSKAASAHPGNGSAVRPVSHEAAAAATAAAPTALGSAAGGGGRWVHVDQ